MSGSISKNQTWRKSIGVRENWAEVHVGEFVFRTRYGTDFASVEKGQWVIFPNADGYFWLSRNWGNAAETADLHLGSEVEIRRIASSE